MDRWLFFHGALHVKARYRILGSCWSVRSQISSWERRWRGGDFGVGVWYSRGTRGGGRAGGPNLEWKAGEEGFCSGFLVFLGVSLGELEGGMSVRRQVRVLGCRCKILFGLQRCGCVVILHLIFHTWELEYFDLLGSVFGIWIGLSKCRAGSGVLFSLSV